MAKTLGPHGQKVTRGAPERVPLGEHMYLYGASWEEWKVMVAFARKRLELGADDSTDGHQCWQLKGALMSGLLSLMDRHGEETWAAWGCSTSENEGQACDVFDQLVLEIVNIYPHHSDFNPLWKEWLDACRSHLPTAEELAARRNA